MGLLPTLVDRIRCGCAIDQLHKQFLKNLMLAEDPLIFGLIYILKFSYNFSYFIGQVSKNISLNHGNTS